MFRLHILHIQLATLTTVKTFCRLINKFLVLPEYRKSLHLFIKAASVSQVCGGQIEMVKFECVSCGMSEDVNVLPGKHAVMGAANNLNRKSDCCKKPEYIDSTGFKQDRVNRNLRSLITAFRA
jgi:hypothetical protein